MSRYLRFSGWVLLLAAFAIIVGAYVALAITDGFAALKELLGSFTVLDFVAVAAAFLPGVALIKMGAWLDNRGRDDAGEQVCDVCSAAPAAGVFSSRYGPVSHAACATCREEGAESMFMACFHIHHAGGPEKAEERFAHMRSFQDGRYVGLAEILTVYPDYVELFESD
jgi:hypothetical protein